MSTEAGALPRLALAGVFGGLFCGYLGLSAAIPVLPAHVRDQFGAGDLAVGLAVTATALTALLTRPIFGGLADRYGHRCVMRFGALAIAAGGLLYFLPVGLAGLIVVRLLLGIGEAALFTAGAVWTVALAPHHRRGQVIGLYGIAMWGGISLGTALGAVLRHFGIDAVWAFCAAAPLLGAVLINIVVPQPHVAAASGRGLLLRPAVLPGLGLALGAAGYVGLAAFVISGLQERGIDAGVVVLSTFSAVYAGTRLFIGHLPDQLGPRRVASWCGAGEAAGLLIIAWAPNLPVAVLGAVVMGVGFSLLHPSLALMVMNNTENTKQGAAIGAYTSFWDLGLFVWGPATGAIATGFGYPAVFVVGAACALAASVLAMTIRQAVTTEKAVGR
ncbi:putative major facilitator superfamily transporter [Nocardia brasiliensis NBRC 14402]|uniref:MFS transporter n=1 Tax=Nocardia brasiliensis TaxID=37326 RepID=UPI0002D6E758|nr:MFS transporter [Nocardia brasiliensis]ASF07752.1 MFS transporter [Nocardia brasiliensis]GAJ83006.1 putative major facilitator superfamily transporter [Nocardia brasiliensis NBRC 14402]SUB54676.1 major facilitator superfamily transporter [Nocardia brasiliensis]